MRNERDDDIMKRILCIIRGRHSCFGWFGWMCAHHNTYPTGCECVRALIKLIKAFSGCKITWIGDACACFYYLRSRAAEAAGPLSAGSPFVN